MPRASATACALAPRDIVHSSGKAGLTIRQLLERTGKTFEDVDLWEVNEAFAAMVLSVLHDLPEMGGGKPIFGAISHSVTSTAKQAGRRRGGRGRSRGGAAAAANGDTLASPMQGTIVKIAVANGDTVAEGDLIVVLEAMKMEQPLTAHKSGVIKDLSTSTGDTVSAGTVLANITD